MDINFAHLHLHTEYSLLDGANRISDLAKRVKKLGMKAVGMTDHGNLFGAVDFYKAMRAEDIKPIIGLEAYIHNSEELGDKSHKQRFHLCLYAKNEVGYKNLMYLSSMSYIEGFYYYPRINKKLLKERSEGLVASSACLQGEILWHLNLNNDKNVKYGAKGYERAKMVALEYQDIFGEDFYIELMRHGIEDQAFVDEQILSIAKECGIKIVATNDTHYPTKKDAEAHEAFMCISMNETLDNPNRLKHSVQEFYLKSPSEMAELYADIPEALENTIEIVDKCNLELKLGNPTPPSFKFTKEYAKNDGVAHTEDAEYFAYRCEEGLKDRLKIVPQERHEEYKKRLAQEIEIINSMKFPGYMLIVWDFVREAKRLGIPVGPGRGSAAGSLVAFSLQITDIDPMKYDLLFERFLNPERVSMPDIDMDFCQFRRSEIIKYVVEKYGRFNVAQVITFGSLLAKGVIRDVGRVLGVAYSEVDAFAKLIPDELNITLNGKGDPDSDKFKKGAFQKEPKIKELVDSSPISKKIWEFATQLEGLKRNAGTHAAAVVIDPEKELWHKTPLYKPSGEDTIATQYSMNYLEPVDLIKFDFLGLKTLTVIDNALKLIKNRYDKDIDFHTIDENDENVYKTIQSGHTIGLFQIESRGMQDLNRRLKPNSFEDIIAVLALYRPGPMESGMVEDFIQRKHGKAQIEYMFPELEQILKPTYGVIVYQEQVMQIVQAIGGFTLGGADLVRRAMGKKKAEEMEKAKKEFVEGAKTKGFEGYKAAELFDLIEKFAGYGFNKSHSAAYAMITFQTAYLKTYYPQEFMAALLTSELDNTDKIVKYVDEVKRLKIRLLPPDINRSILEFSSTVLDGEDVILFGLGAIKGLGSVAIRKIIQEREESGIFEDWEDFLSRIETQKVNKKALESLIKAGAMDRLNRFRRSMLENIEHLIESAKRCEDAKKMMENSLFGESGEVIKAKIEINDSGEYELKQILELEKETLGFYVSGHPLDEFRDEIQKVKYTLSSAIDTVGEGEVMFVGKAEDITTKISKNGNKFGILKIMDFHGEIEAVIFGKELQILEGKDLKKPLAFKCNLSRGDFVKIKVDKILDISEAKNIKVNTLIEERDIDEPLLITIEREHVKLLEELRIIAEEFSGKRRLNLIIKDEQKEIFLETGVSVSSKMLEKIDRRYKVA